MEVRNCKNCGRLFNYIGGHKICPECTSELEKKFIEVKESIRENKKLGINEVSELTGVAIKQIKQWVVEERLEFSSTVGSGVLCEKCGIPIVTGKYCPKCKQDIQHNLASAYSNEPGNRNEVRKKQREKDRMRFLDN